MTNPLQLSAAPIARYLVVCLALFIGASCEVGNGAASRPNSESLVDSGTDPIPDAPEGLTIVTPPASQVVAVNSTVSLSAVINGQIEKIEWRKGESVIANANELTLTLKNVQSSDSGQYVLKVSNAVGSVDLKATLTVATAPVIKSRPKTVSGYLGQSATLSVDAVGANLAYEWFKNGVALPSQTAKTLTIASLTSKSAGTYKVTVSNISGSVSAQAAVVVNGPPVVQTGLSDTTLDVGSPLFLEVAASGEGINYAWFKDGVQLPGQLTRDYQTTATLADAGSTPLR